MSESITYEQIGEILGLAAARDQRTVGDGDVMAWYDDLNTAAVSYADARGALAAFYVEQANVRPEHRFRITTPDVIRLARQARRERVRNFVYEPVDPDEPWQQFHDRMRAQLRAIGDGRVPPPQKVPALEGGPAPNVAAELRGLLREVPDDEDGDGEPKPRVGAMTVTCPREDCKARVGRQCKRPSGKPRTEPHPARIALAQGKAYDPDAERAEMDRRRAASAALLNADRAAS
ncbi:zinc finger domain-containing protein [Streptomyces sp. NPDC004763]